MEGPPDRAADVVATVVPAAETAGATATAFPPPDPGTAAVADEIRTLVGAGVPGSGTPSRRRIAGPVRGAAWTVPGPPATGIEGRDRCHRPIRRVRP